MYRMWTNNHGDINMLTFYDSECMNCGSIGTTMEKPAHCIRCKGALKLTIRQDTEEGWNFNF